VPSVSNAASRLVRSASSLDEHTVKGDVVIPDRVQVEDGGRDRRDAPARPQRGKRRLGQRAPDQVGDRIDGPTRQHHRTLRDDPV